MVSLSYDRLKNLQGRPKLVGMGRDPRICQRVDCLATRTHLYCRRCILDLRRKLAPSMQASEIEHFYTAVGRTRALTEPESVVLEEAVRILRNSKKRKAA